MSLWARIAPNAADKIPVHQLFAVMVEFQRGQLTQAQVETAFALTPQELADLRAIITQLNRAGNLANKLAYLEAIHSVFILVETGDYTEAKTKSSLGF